MAVVKLIVMFSILSTTLAATVPPDSLQAYTTTTTCNPNTGEGCQINPEDCQEMCGCNRIYKYDKIKEECVLDLEYLKEITAAKSYVNTDSDMSDEDGIASTSIKRTVVSYPLTDFSSVGTARLRERVDRVFRGILISATLFVVCACICVVSVCVFCCHIHQSDRKLKEEVSSLAAKLKVDVSKKDKAPLVKKEIREMQEGSCSVVVQDANVFCV